MSKKIVFKNQGSSINPGGGVQNGTGLSSAIIRLGVDCGNGHFKTNGKSFPSAAKMGEMPKVARAEGMHEVKVGGTYWTVGSGEKFIRDDRYTDRRYKVCLLTAIAMEAKSRGITASNLIVDLCVGLPQDLHKNDDLIEDLKATLTGWGKTHVEVDNRIEDGINANYTIEIRKVIVFVEGALVLLSGETGRVLTLDIGEGTYNCLAWENGAIVADATEKLGAQSIFQLIKDQLYATTRKSFTASEIENYIVNDNYLLPVGEEGATIDMSEQFGEWIDAAVNNIYTDICNTGKFNFNTIEKVQLLGGAAIFTKEYFESIPALKGKVELVENAQFINSEIYEAVINNA